MGLDMQLMKKHYVKNYKYTEPEDKFNISIKMGNKKTNIDIENITEIITNVAIWRKANAIHKWFVDNVQEENDDCGTYNVSIKQLNKLLKIITEILKNKTKAPELLPTQEGFFFGTEEYDKNYFEDLRYTEDQLIKALKTNGDDWDRFTYSSSW